MSGTMIVVSMDGSTRTQELSHPDSDVFHAAVGGWLELVPFFDTVFWDGQIHKCIVFCDEEGKLKNKEPNFPATEMWKQAQARSSHFTEDYLVGNICVIFGDPDFMRNM